MKKVSVIIPVYNISTYLPQCLDSVLGQTYSDLEVLVIDDGSADGSQKICDNYAAADNRILVIHQENAGAANAKNKGLDLASGAYLTFLDGDDYVDPNWIEKLVNALETNQADLVECSFVREFKDHSEAGNEADYTNQMFSASEYMAQYLDRWTNSLFWNKLFKAELTKDVRFRKERRCIDDEFYTYKITGSAKRIVRIADELYHYRQRRSGAVFSQDKSLQRTDDALEIIEERYKWIESHFPNLRSYVLRHDVSNMHFFARCFPFTKSSMKVFRRISKKYLVECIINHYNSELTKNTLLLFKYRKKQFFKETERRENTAELYE